MKVHQVLFVTLLAIIPHVACAVIPEQTATSAKEEECSTDFYRFFPGDANFCLAGKYWKKDQYRRSEKMLELAAGWASKPAQHILGVVHFNGDGLARNRPLGLAWLALAAERGDPRFTAVLNSAYASASEKERAEASRLLVDLRPRYGDAYAARRAATQFERAMRDLNVSVYDWRTCIRDITTASPVRMADPDCMGGSTFSVELHLRKLSNVYFNGWKGREGTVVVHPLLQTNIEGDPAQH